MSKKQRKWGTGSCWKDGGRWQAKHRRTGESARFAKKAEAEEWLRQQNRKVRRQGTGAFKALGTSQPDLTFGKAWELYSEIALPHREKATRLTEQRAWKRLLSWTPEGRTNPFWLTRQIRSVRLSHIEDYRVWRTRGGVALATLAQELRLLRRLGNWAAEQGLCSVPRVRWKVPPQVGRMVDPVSEAEYRQLVGSASPIQKAMLVWLWNTGCRPGELGGIRREHFRPHDRLVVIPNFKTGRRTGRLGREFPLEAKDLIQSIKDRDSWLQRIVDTKKSLPRCKPSEAKARLESEWLFPRKTGDMLSDAGYRGALKTCYASAGIESLDLIGFRHAFATRFLQGGGDVLTLARLMGTSVTMIDRTYGHLTMDHARSVLRKMGQTPKDDAETTRNDEVSEGKVVYLQVS